MLIAQLRSVIDTLTEPAAILGVVIVLAGLALGFKDLPRFSLTRASAIAWACFTQAIRRRVLAIVPLVIVALLLVTQFQRAEDAQDATRQTTNA